MVEDKISYNRSSMDRFGWSWETFGVPVGDWNALFRSVEEFQEEYDLKKDGLVGPTTFRVLSSCLEAIAIEEAKKTSGSEIICYDKAVPIEWDKVSLWYQEDSLILDRENYREVTNRKRNVTQFINHWDVCLSSKSCVRVMNKRGTSVHFCIDNDGTIHQLMNTQDIAWHTGGDNRGNPISIGVEISNAYYPKFQETYKRMGFGERPIMSDCLVHGKKLKPFLGFYDVQLQALLALWKAVGTYYDIPYKTSLNDAGQTSGTFDIEASEGRKAGFFSHYHLTKRKIDCANLDIEEMLRNLRG